MKPTVEFLNKWAHEFLGECWHEWKPAIDPSRHSLLGVKGCSLCGHYTTFKEVKDGGPNYCSDLNLSAKVKEKIPKDKQNDYMFNLTMALIPACAWSQYWAIVTATAKQEVRACHATMEKK